MSRSWSKLVALWRLSGDFSGRNAHQEHNGVLNPLQRGAANIAIRGILLLTSVVITVSEPMLGKGERWYHAPRCGPNFVLSVEEDIATAPYCNRVCNGDQSRTKGLDIAPTLAVWMLFGDLNVFLLGKYNDMFDLINEVKIFIIDTLDLEDVTPADIDEEEPLFVEGLSLDSIDALELGVALQKHYGLKILTESEKTRQHFASVRTLAEYIFANRAH